VYAALALYYDNPTNTDPEAVAEKPPNAHADTPASNYGVRYFRQSFNYDGTVSPGSSDIEIFVIDCMSYRSTMATNTAEAATMLGAVQKAWLKKYLKESVAATKLIFSGKKTYNSAGGDNNDTFGNWPYERDELEAYIAAGTDWVRPGGVVWLTGDRHVPHVISKADHVCICGCSVSLDDNVSKAAVMNLTNNITFIERVRRGFGMVDVTPEGATLYLMSSLTGDVMWGPATVAPGSNSLTYPRPRLAG